jgi:hypothetical protein
MSIRHGFILLCSGLALAACTQQPRPQAQAPRQAPAAMSGTAAGSGETPLEAAARARAGEGCVDASPGMPRITGADQGVPQVQYQGRPTGPGAGDPSRRLGQYGMQQSCP